MIGKILSNKELEHLLQALETKDSAIIARSIFTIDSVCKHLKKLFLGIEKQKLIDCSNEADSLKCSNETDWVEIETVIKKEAVEPLLISIRQKYENTEPGVRKRKRGRPRKTPSSSPKSVVEPKKMQGAVHRQPVRYIIQCIVY